MFVSLASGDHQATSDYITRVRYYLHATFCPSVVVVKDPPFLLSRIGWGYFKVIAEVHFKKGYGLSPLPLILEHELNFLQP